MNAHQPIEVSIDVASRADIGLEVELTHDHSAFACIAGAGGAR